jgi:hypothetical protein
MYALFLACAPVIAVEAPWVFSNGAEFPGAAGSVTSFEGRTGEGVRLAFDMSGGGAYVSASKDLAQPAEGRAVAFWVLSGGGVRLSVRVVDSTGQTLQCAAACHLETAGPLRWRRAFADLSAPMFHWGGADDGVVHGGIKQVAILVEPYKNGNTYSVVKGEVDFDDVTFIDSFSDEIDVYSKVVPTGNTGELAGRLGVNIHFTRDDRALDIIKAAGFKWVRMDLVWIDVEKKPGVYDFSAYDKLISSLNARGLKALFILDYGNLLYTSAWNAPPVTDAARAAFGKFAKACAKHFAGNNIAYEIWNEPNLAFFWASPNPADYAALSRLAVSKVKEGDPRAEVAVGALSGMDLSYLEPFLSAGGARGADAVSVHPYRQHGPETVSDDVSMIRTALRKHIPVNTPPVWDSEWGYSSGWYGPGDSAAARKTQAKMAVREIISGWAMGFPLMIYYDIRDDGVNPADPEHNFGLLARDYTDKPAMVAVRTLLKNVANRTLKGIYPRSPNGINAIALDGAKDRLVIVWSPAAAGEARFKQKPSRVTDFLGKDLPLLESGIIQITDEPLYCYFPKR